MFTKTTSAQDFNMDTGNHINPTPSTEITHNASQAKSSIVITSENSPPLEFLTSQIAYEAHLGTKMDYFFSYSFYMLRRAELALLQKYWGRTRFILIHYCFHSRAHVWLATFQLKIALSVETSSNVG